MGKCLPNMGIDGNVYLWVRETDGKLIEIDSLGQWIH